MVTYACDHRANPSFPTLRSSDLLSLSASANNLSTSVSLSGSATAGLNVVLSGVVTGSLPTDGYGNDNGSLTVSSLGRMDATVSDAWGQTANASTVLVVAAPTLSL